MSRHITSLAVAAAVLVVAVLVTTFLAWQLLGGGVWRAEVNVLEAQLRSPNTLGLIVGSCKGNPEVSQLRETDRDVQVEVVASSTPLRGGLSCADIVEVQLKEPLGDRVVVDKHTGQPVSVTKVNSSSH